MMSSNTRGILAMTASMAVFVVSDTLIKIASDAIGAAQLLFVRGLLLTPAIFVIALRMGALNGLRASLKPKPILRTLCEGTGTFAYVIALTHIPIATALAINMVTPLPVLPLAMWLLGERIAFRQFFAVLAGLSGVLLVLRPSIEGIDFWLLVSLSSALIFAIRDTVTRGIPRGVPTVLILLWGAFSGAVAGAVGTGISGWRPIDLSTAAMIAASAVLVGIAMMLLIQSMRLGEVSAVSPFRYTAILCAVLSGYLVWGQLPDATTLAGIALIVGAGLFALAGGRFSARDRAPPASG